jgi:flagellar biosynthetic protein FlhB
VSDPDDRAAALGADGLRVCDAAGQPVLATLGEKLAIILLAKAGSLISESVMWLTLCLVLIAMIDVPYQKYSFMKRMRMTKQEIKDEHKDMEGRPEVKAQIRRRQREVAPARMMQKVKEADVIITNPEHFAVALSYDPTADGAPAGAWRGAQTPAAIGTAGRPA